MRVIEAINGELRFFLQSDSRNYIIGEDIVDPYGGAFKATKGLSSDYPNQVISMPISESGMVGFATGCAMTGCTVSVEIMFGDFITLALDQMINHLSKLPWVYNDQISCPVIIRTPMGGRRGYGATHSQSLEKVFCGIPGLSVTAISEFSDVKNLYRRILSSNNAHVLIENKAIYPRYLSQNPFEASESPDLFFVTYGGCVSDCVEAAELLFTEEEVTSQVIEIAELWPFDASNKLSEIPLGSIVITVEEGSRGWGFGSEVASKLVLNKLRYFGTIASSETPIPSSKILEDRSLPSAETVVRYAMEILEEYL